MYHLTEAYLMAGLISLIAAYLGALVFGSGAVAPLVVRVLGETAAAPLLRAYWPRFHGFAVLSGTAFTLLLAVGSGWSAVPGIYASLVIALAGLMTIVFFVAQRLIPAINAARERGAMQRFNALHRLSVILVASGMLLAAALLAALIYVLPGQFTFWPASTAPAAAAPLLTL